MEPRSVLPLFLCPEAIVRPFFGPGLCAYHSLGYASVHAARGILGALHARAHCMFPYTPLIGWVRFGPNI